jgi:hypothetical protein
LPFARYASRTISANRGAPAGTLSALFPAARAVVDTATAAGIDHPALISHSLRIPARFPSGKS